MQKTNLCSYFLFLFLFILCYTVFRSPSALAQAPDENYEARAQEVMAGLARFNGLMGWEPGSPSAWPFAPFDVDPDSQIMPTAAYQENGAAFSRDVPARLLGLRLSNMNLGRGGDFSGLPSLLSLELAGNDFRALNLLGNTALRRLNITKNQVTALDISQSPELIWVSLAGNHLENLDTGGNPQLMELLVSMNQLSRLNLTDNPRLTVLEATNNRLASLYVDRNPLLTRLFLSYNQLEELFVGNNPLLTQLGVRDNQLTALDVTANPELVELTASRNQISDIDLRGNPRLEAVMLDQNNIHILDMSANPNLVSLQAQNNPLVELRLGQNPLSRLETLNVDGCRLPLSRLYPLSGLAKNRGRLGAQEQALFEEISLEFKDGEAILDLSGEASFGGEATEFLALNDKKRRLRPSEYAAKNGVVHFYKPGRYMVMMTNKKVFSSDINQLTGRVHAIKAKVYTGFINVAAPETR